MIAPVVYVFLWMTIFGGAGLRMEREAAGAGLCCHNINMTVIAYTVANVKDARINVNNKYDLQ